MKDELKVLIGRDLKKLRSEIDQYRSEEAIWSVEVAIANSGGNLALHLIGNLNAYIGEGLGKSGYIRDRDAEFALKNIPKAKLIEMIEDTTKLVDSSLNELKEDQLKGKFPILIWEKETGMEFTLIHLAMHLSYHLGQINYHRRLLDVDSSS